MFSAMDPLRKFTETDRGVVLCRNFVWECFRLTAPHFFPDLCGRFSVGRLGKFPEIKTIYLSKGANNVHKRPRSRFNLPKQATGAFATAQYRYLKI